MKENTQTTEKALIALIQEIASAKNTLKNVQAKIDEIVDIFKKGLTSENWEKLAKVLFYPIGKTTFYRAYLYEYFLQNGVVFTYNVKKERIYYAGKVESIKQTYADYKNEVKQEKQKELANLSTDERLKVKYKSIETLSNEKLDMLAKFIQTIRKK